MDDTALLRILKQESEDAASYHQSELARVQADALKRYQAEPYGDELPGRSSVRTHEIEDAINWAMPHILRPFVSGDDLISVDDPRLDDGDPTLRQAADYLSHVFRKDNKPSRLIHDLAFDGLLMRVGVGRTYWVDPEPKPARVMEGVSPEQLAKYEQDPEYEVIEVDEETKEAEGQSYVCYTIKVQHKPKMGRVRMDCIPPEEFRISKRARSIEEADYHAWHRDEFLAEIIRDFPKFRDQLLTKGTGENTDSLSAGDSRVEARWPNESSPTEAGQTADEIGRRKVVRAIEFIRADYDGDGTVELRRVHRVGDVILENDAVEESELSIWSPVRMSHRAVGRSTADQLMDLQKIQTGLTRAALDGLSRSLQPRTAVNADMTTPDTYQDILDHDTGGLVRVKGDVRQAMAELAIPNVAGDALAAIQFFDQKKEEASGVDSHAQGISPEAITKTKGGIAMLQAAANARIELIARWLGECVEEMLGKAMRLLIMHQDGPRMVKIQGQRIPIDPRRWSDEMTVTVHIGAVGEDRDAKLAGLAMIMAKQEQVIASYGPSNPLCTVQEYRNAAALAVEALGHKRPERFFKEIPLDYQPPPPQPDPKTVEAQQKGQLAAAELQQKTQLQAAEIHGKQQLAKIELDGKAHMAAVQAQVDAQIAGIKAENEFKIAQMRIAAESEIARERLNAEMQIAGFKAVQDAKAKKAQVNASAKGKMRNGAAKVSQGDGVRMGGNIG